MTATIGAAIFGSRPELITATYRAPADGLRESEAANLTALKNGFLITSQPWTVREQARLLFLRELARRAPVVGRGRARRDATHIQHRHRPPGASPRCLG